MSTDVRSNDPESVSKKRRLLEKFKEEFENAELAIKEGELNFGSSADGLFSATAQGLFIPAINELRYAGKHLGDFALSEDNLDDLYDAVSHCIRAKHDAYDCLVQYCLRDIRLFMEQYKLLAIGDVVDNYAECKRQINEVVKRSGRKSEEDDRVEIIDCLKENKESTTDSRIQDYETLRNICQKFDFHRDDLNKKLKKENTERFYRLLTLIIAALTLVVTLLSYLAP